MRLTTIVLCAMQLLLIAPVHAGNLSAQDIARNYFNHHRGWGKLSAHLHMELTQGSASATRDLDVRMLEAESSGERDLVRVLKPADLKGTAVLTYTHDSAADEQWVYLPAIRRVKRLTLESKGGAFLSSQFAFEDLLPFQLQKYTYRRLPDDTYQGEPCYVMESVPVAGSSVYGRLVHWIAKSDYRLLKTRFFDKDNYLQKTLYIEKHQLYRDKYLRPVRLKMVDESSGDTTVSIWSDLVYDRQLDEREFDVTSLKRIGF